MPEIVKVNEVLKRFIHLSFFLLVLAGSAQAQLPEADGPYSAEVRNIRFEDTRFDREKIRARVYWPSLRVGDEEASEKLQTDGIEAIEAMIEALKDEDAREMIKLGMLLGGQTAGSWTIENCSYCNSKAKAEFARGETASDSFTGQVGVEVETDLTLGIFSHADDFESADLDERLDMVKEPLEAQRETLTTGTWSH